MAAAITTGVHTIDATDYHNDTVADQPTLSASIAAILCTQTPAHAWVAHPKLNPNFERHEEQKFDVGTCAHSLLLEGESAVRVVYADDWRTKEAKELRDQARAHGQTPLLEKHWDAVQAMVAAIRVQLDRVDAHPSLFTDGKPEQTLVWDEDGVTCRARLDWLRDDHRAADDLKTTSRSANPEAWARSLFGSGRDVQAALYRRAIRAVTGVDADFRYCIAETYPPYAMSVVSLAPSALALADEKVGWAIDVWRDCLKNDRWPAYTNRVAYAELPAWEEARWLDREAREDVAA